MRLCVSPCLSLVKLFTYMSIFFCLLTKLVSGQRCIFPPNDSVSGTSDSIRVVNINRCSSWQADRERLMCRANDTEFAALTE